MKVFILHIFLFFASVSFSQCDSVPPLNQGIVDFVNTKMNKKVGRGECWDLAKYALDEVEAKWDQSYVYGRLLSKDECIYPGDIIQFEKVKIKYKEGNKTFTEAMPHHTAIIYETINQDEVILAHQNTGYSGKKVGTSKLKFSTIISGKYYIYRPEK